MKVGDEMVYEYLLDNYKKGEPIFLSDIRIEGMTEENIRYHLKRLTDTKVIERFSAGVYYFPKVDVFGEKMLLSPETVAIHKYILRKGKPIGFYSGHTLANKMGLSMQVPLKEEITSNYSPAQVREISIKNRKYILRRPIVEVTEDNKYILELLDCLKDLDNVGDSDMKMCGNILTKFAKEHNITKEMVNKFIGFYPLKIYKSIYESEVEYVSA